MRRILFEPHSAPGVGASSDPLTESTPKPTPGAAPAADAVINAEITEDTIKLREELETTKTKLKQREIEHASLTDEHQRFKDATEARQQPTPVPVRKKSPEEKSFRLGRFV